MRVPSPATCFALALALAWPVAADAQGAADAEAGTCAPGRAGCYLASDGAWRNADEDHALMLGEPDPDYLRATVEGAVFLGIGTTWYWLDKEHNLADWDYDSWRQRLSLDAFRFDNNAFYVNYVYHPVGGAYFYAFGRANDFGVLGAGIYSFLVSTGWELLIEFRERISVNDVIVTPAAGVAIGELLHKLALYVNSTPPGRPRSHVLRWTAGAPVSLHDALDGRQRGHEDAPVDDMGFDAALWHDFRFAYGLSRTEARAGDAFWIHRVGLAAELVSMPGYLREGTFSRLFTDAAFTSASLSVEAGADGWGLGMVADTILLGGYWQSLARGPGGLWGEAFAAGTSLSFLYRDQDQGAFRDQLSITGLFGLSFNTTVAAGSARLRLQGHLQPAFAGVHSAAWPLWAADHDGETAKSILRKQGYYYAWGIWARLRASVELPLVQLGCELSYSAFDSQEGMDRTQDAITADVDATDRALEWTAWLRVTPFAGGPYLEAGLGGIDRRSRLEDRRARTTLDSATLGVGITW